MGQGAPLAAKQLVVSGAGRGAMESGRSAAYLVPIINLEFWQLRFICVTGSICIFDSFPVEHVGIRFISRGTSAESKGASRSIEDRKGVLLLVCKSGTGGTGRRPQIQMRFRREMHL